jgi:hypothetical protein
VHHEGRHTTSWHRAQPGPCRSADTCRAHPKPRPDALDKCMWRRPRRRERDARGV